MKNAKFDTAFIDLEGTDLLSSPVIDYEKFKKAFLICNMVVITNFLIDGVKQPSVQVELEKDDEENIIFYLTHYKVVIGAEEVTVTAIETSDELKNEITGAGITNAKPIYIHPVDIAFSGGSGRIGCLIFNNNPAPFTKDTFIDYIDELYNNVGETIRIVTTGVINVSGAGYPAVILARRATTPLYKVTSEDSSGTDISLDFASKSELSSSISFLNDGVNKIN